MPGMTAWWGLMQIGKPKAGETVVISAASGAVGSVVGQLARLHGCRAVGIAGGKDKCDYVEKELGFDACVDYRAAGANLFKELRAAAPKGIDVYFENVGGAVQAAVLPQLNDFARVPLCGLISQYNEMQMSAGPDWRLLLVKRATVTGFIVSDHFGQMEGFWKEVPAAVNGAIRSVPRSSSSTASRSATSASRRRSAVLSPATSASSPTTCAATAPPTSRPTPRPIREARSGRKTSPPSWPPRSSSGPCWSAGRWGAASSGST
jgi:NADPH:quinone reductase-like Zn-dependent oxidoreductase